MSSKASRILILKKMFSCLLAAVHAWPNSRPRYPRPTLVRADARSWRVLHTSVANGIAWHVDPTVASLIKPPVNAPSKLPPSFRPISVPFPVESNASGVARPLERGFAWYHMVTDARVVPPRSPSRTRILLHLEAVDWEVTVIVNRALQAPLGERGGAAPSSLLHRGGSTPVSYDITDSVLGPCAAADVDGGLCPPGAIEFVIGIRDPSSNSSAVANISDYNAAGASAAGANPVGKQRIANASASARSAGWFSPVSGIHAPIWLEGVPSVYVESLALAPKVASALPSREGRAVAAATAAPSGALTLEVVLRDSGAVDAGVGAGYLARARVFSAIQLQNSTDVDFLDPRAANASVVATALGAFALAQEAFPRAFVGTSPAPSPGRAAAAFALVIPSSALRLWAPSSPWLHGVEVDLIDNTTGTMHVVETVSSYAGMRVLAVAGHGTGGSGVHITLNGEPHFLLGAREQGRWPRTLTTAPSDAALAADVRAARDLGYNAVLKEDVVGERRYYFHADCAGLMVVQSLPSLSARAARAARPPVPRRAEGEASSAQPPTSVQPTAPMEAQFILEAVAIVAARMAHPSIVAWAVFTEGRGEADGDGGAFAAAAVKAVSAHGQEGRLLIAAIGWDSFDLGAVRALTPAAGAPLLPRDRRAPAASKSGARPLLLANIGGWSLRAGASNATQCVAFDEEGAAVTVLPNAASFTANYAALTAALALQRRGNATLTPLSGAVFDQLFDVERQCSGILSATRTVKVDPDAVRAANAALLAAALG